MRTISILIIAILMISQGSGQDSPPVKIVELSSGNTLEGEIIDETDGQVSLKLRTGLVLRLSRDTIRAILDPSEVVVEEETEILPEATDELNLSKLFESPNPTPTPLTIVPLDLRLNFKLQRDRNPNTLRPLPPILADPVEALEEVDLKSPEEAIGQDYGKVVWTQGLLKYRPAGGVWRPALTDTSIAIGDQINTLSGRAQIYSTAGIVTRLHAGTQIVFEAGGNRIEEGKAWIQNSSSEESFSVHIAGIEAVIERGILNVEHLKTGYKIVLLAGEAALFKQPEKEVIQGDLQGPTSVLLDINREVVQISPPAETAIQEWEAWEISAPKPDPASMALGGAAEDAPLADREMRFLNQIDDLQILAEGVQSYYLDMGKFPRERRPFLADLSTDPNDSDWKGPYLGDRTPPILDQWGSELVYRIRTDPISAEIQAEIFSLGPNKQFEGGEGDDVGIVIPRPGS